MSKHPQPAARRIRHPRHPRRPDAGPDHRRGDAADLRHFHLRAEQPRRAQGLRVLAQPESDALRLRALHRRPGGRHARLRLRFRAGGDRDAARAAVTGRSRDRLG